MADARRAGCACGLRHDGAPRRHRQRQADDADGEAPRRRDAELRPSPFLYLSVGLVAGAVIALQIGIMRIFSVGSWAHFGSLVVSLAMLGFGLTSAVMCIAQGWFERHWRGVAATSLLLFGPLTVGANLAGPADAVQRHLPGLRSGAEMAAGRQFPALHAAVPGRRLLSRHGVPQGAADLRPRLFRRPDRLRPVRAAVPRRDVLGPAREPADRAARCCGSPAACCGSWPSGAAAADRLAGRDRRRLRRRAPGCAELRRAQRSRSPTTRAWPTRANSPTAERVYESASPFGYLEVYSSSYLHFAPGLSDNAAFNLPTMPANAYLGLYIDGEGPSGIIRDCPPDETAYFRYLPMIYPYLIKKAPETFVVQFGGGISTAVALQAATRRASRWRRAIRRCSRPSATTRAARLHRRHPQQPEAAGHRLRRPALSRPHRGPLRHHRPEPRRFRRPVEPRRLRHRREVRLHARGHGELHARPEARRHALGDAVEQGRAAEVGAEALRHHGRGGARSSTTATSPIASSSSSSYLSTATVLYKRGGFTPEEIDQAARAHRAPCRSTRSTPRASPSTPSADRRSSSTDYRNQIFPDEPTGRPERPADAPEAPPAEAPPENGTRCPPRRWASSPGTIWCTAAGTRSPALRLRHAPAHQRPALFRRLCEAGGPAARHRPAGAAPGRVGLSC